MKVDWKQAWDFKLIIHKPNITDQFLRRPVKIQCFHQKVMKGTADFWVSDSKHIGFYKFSIINKNVTGDGCVLIWNLDSITRANKNYLYYS